MTLTVALQHDAMFLKPKSVFKSVIISSASMGLHLGTVQFQLCLVFSYAMQSGCLAKVKLYVFFSSENGHNAHCET